MSKKLLLNNFSSGSSEGLTPVQNGLVCWLDAFDLTTYEFGTIWEDRTNNNNNGTVAMIPTDVALGNGVLKAKSFVNIPNPTKGLTNYTVEIGYEDVMKRYWCGLWGNTSNSNGNTPNGVSFYHGNNRIQTHPLYFYPPEKTELSGGKNYITFTFEETMFTIYVNGEYYSKQTYNDGLRVNPSNANYLCFMCRKTNTVDETTETGTDFISNKWYFIRIYNRTLTEEEIFNNYNYELSLKRG